jgi:hypothetical protein
MENRFVHDAYNRFGHQATKLYVVVLHTSYYTVNDHNIHALREEDESGLANH